MTGNGGHPDANELLNPTMADAQVNAGAVLHFVASQPDIRERFTRWIEHCPGDLDDAFMVAWLGATHDMLQPDCPEPVTVLPELPRARRVKFWAPAAEHEVYEPHAFDRLIGTDAPFTIEGAERGRAVVVSVEVAPDGRGATWTVDIEPAP